VSDGAIASSNDFKESVSIRSSTLQLNGQSREQDNLNSSARGVPERSRNTTRSKLAVIDAANLLNSLVICDRRGLQQSSSPSPGRNDSSGDKTRFDGATSSREHLRCLQFIVVSLEDEGGQNHTQGEEETNANDDAITHCRRQGRGDVSAAHDVQLLESNLTN